MIKLVGITQPLEGETVIIAGIHGTRKARYDNPVEIGLAVVEVVLGQPVNPIPAHCAVHEWRKNNGTD